MSNDALAVQHLDPFSIVYDAIWDLIESNPTIAGIVRLGNRIRWTGGTEHSSGPRKTSVQDGDLPEIEVRPSAFQGSYQSSSSFAIVRNFTVRLIASERQMLDVEVFRLEWELMRALSGIEGLSDRFRWVTDARLTSAVTVGDQPDFDRAKHVWQDLMTVTVQMSMDRTSHMQADEPVFYGD